MKTETIQKFVTVHTAVIVAILTVTAFTGLRAGGFSESFEGIPNGTTLTSANVPNWSQVSGALNQSFISNTAGYPSGNGLKITANGVGAFYMPAAGASAWSATDGSGVFTMDFNLQHASQQVSTLVMGDWSNFGFQVQVDGYNSLIKLSTGGASCYAPTTASYGLALSDNTWYTLKISGITLGGAAQNISGLVSIFAAANPGTLLLDNKTITAAGGTNLWSDLTFVQVTAYGDVTSTNSAQYDNLSLAVPEPGSGILILFGIGLMSLIRRRTPSV